MKTKTYICVVAVKEDTVLFELPEHRPDEWIEIPKHLIPSRQRPYIHPGFKCQVTVDITPSVMDITHITNWD